MKISFIIPCYRSENTIEAVIKEITVKMQERVEFDYEIITVNDCSPDNVWKKLCDLTKEFKHLKAINLNRNYGQESARLAGLKMATGNYAVCLDDDGQCPMDYLWDLLSPLEMGAADMVVAKYPHKKQSWFKNFGSKINHFMTHQLLDMPAGLEMSNFFAMNKILYKSILEYKNPYPFITGLVCNVTQNIVNVPMEERERFDGTTGYTFKKLLGLWMNGFTNFSIVPLRIADLLGIICAFVGFAFGLISIVRKIVFPEILLGYTSLIASIFFVGGILMLLLGMIGEYIGRIFICINNVPQYVVKETITNTQSK